MGPNQLGDPRAMPLKEFIDETMKALATDADEVLTERVGFLRDATGRGDSAFTTKFNDMFAGH
jgi:uncharacterized oxidoreductase